MEAFNQRVTLSLLFPQEPMNTVYNARHEFLHKISKGEQAECPICHRSAQVNQHPLSSALVLLLDKTYQLFRTTWVPTAKIPMISTPGSDKRAISQYSLLKHFKLFMPHPEEPKWRVTSFAEQFILGGVTVSRYVRVCLDQLLASSVMQISFVDAKYAKTGGFRNVEMLPGALTQPVLPLISSAYSDLTVEEAADKHAQTLRNAKGIRCLLCDRWNQRYKRSVTGDMARVLKSLADVEVGTPGKYSHVYNDLGVKGGDYGKLRIWGLIETNGESGYWRITGRGVEFVNDELLIPKSVILLNNRVVEFVGADISYNDATGTTDLTPA